MLGVCWSFWKGELNHDLPNPHWLVFSTHSSNYIFHYNGPIPLDIGTREFTPTENSDRVIRPGGLLTATEKPGKKVVSLKIHVESLYQLGFISESTAVITK